MSSPNIVEIVLKAIDQASGTTRHVGEEVKHLAGTTGAANEQTKKSGDSAQKTASQIDQMGKSAQKSGFEMWNLSMVATAAFGAVVLATEKAIQVQQDEKNALLGLTSVAAGFRQDVDLTTQAAKDLAADGLMTVADAATGLKNLLSSRFSLPEAINLMERFKDSAAFARQQSLSFGEAIRSATEGIKNGNSILVDNAGVTKNLSIMLEEAGFSAQDLMYASQDAGVRQAIFNGIMRETQHQVGDAAKLTGTLSGELSKNAVAAKEVGIQYGNVLEPSLRSALGAITPLLGNLAEWIKRNPQLASSIGIVTVSLLAMGAAAAAMATFVIPALTAAVGFFATPVGMAALAVGTLTAMLVASAAASSDAEKGLRGVADAQQQEINTTQSHIVALQKAGQEYASLKEKIESGKLSAEQEQKAKADLVLVEQRLRSELGEEGLTRLKSAENTKTAVTAELSALQEKLRVQKEVLQKTILMENEQTLAKIESTQKRIEAVEKEARAYTIWGSILEAGEKASISVNEKVVEIEEKMAKLPGRLGEIHRQNAETHRDIAQKARERLDSLYGQEKTAEISRLAGELTKLRQGYHDVNIDVGISADTTERHEKKTKKQAEALTEQEFELQKLEKRWAAYEAGINDSAKNTAFLTSKKEYLTAKMGLLNSVIEESTAKLNEMANSGKHDEAEMQKLALKILDLQTAQSGLKKEIVATTAEVERQIMDLVKHEAAMRRLSTEQQIDMLRQLRSAHADNSREVWQIDEQLAKLYSDRIKDALKDVEKAYQDQLTAIDAAAESTAKDIRQQMEALDATTKNTIEGLQRVLDQMDEQDRLQDREKAQEDHNNRVKDLLDQRHYHEQRTGKEHKKAIEDIDKRLAEEEQRMLEDQARWEKDDQRRQIQEQINQVQEQSNIQKEGLQKQIDQAQEAAAKQRKDIQEHYAKVTKLAEDGIWDSIAAMAATEPQWFDTGKKLIQSLIGGIKSGQVDLSNETSGIVGQVRTGIESGRGQGGTAVGGTQSDPVATIPRSDYEEIDDRAVIWSRRLAEILGVSVGWDEEQNKVIIGGQAFTPVSVADGKSYVGVRNVAESLGHRVEYDGFSGSIRIYHAGGRVDRTGPAFLQEGEEVIPRRVVEAVRGSNLPNVDLAAIIFEAVRMIIEALEKIRPGLIVQGPLVQNDQVILPAGAQDWIDHLTEGAESWLRGGK